MICVVCEGHALYQDGDQDAPDQIKDRNGQVVLGQCKFCRRAEIELIEPCTAIHVHVVTGVMKESNGRVTHTVTLYRDDKRGIFDGFSIYSSLSAGRALYHAAEFKHFFGQGPKPDILNFDTSLPGEQS